MSNYVVAAGWWYVLAAILVVYAMVEAWHIRHDHAVRLREAAIWTIIYVSAGLLFAVPIFLIIGSRAGSEYLAAFLTEKALSLDNLFVFGLIFAAFMVPKKLERRVLDYGVLGALVLRFIFIFAGISLLQRFEWISIIFGVILLRAAWHAWQDARGQTRAKAIQDTRTWRVMHAILPMSQHYDGNKLTTKLDGKRLLTMLGAVIILIELTDILFAVDSIPAVLAISSNRFIAYASNIFALLGLRALYFVYADVADRFWALKWMVAVILGWISIKLIITPLGVQIPQIVNLTVLLSLLGFGIILSLAYPKARKN